MILSDPYYLEIIFYYLQGDLSLAVCRLVNRLWHSVIPSLSLKRLCKLIARSSYWFIATPPYTTFLLRKSIKSHNLSLFSKLALNQNSPPLTYSFKKGMEDYLFYAIHCQCYSIFAIILVMCGSGKVPLFPYVTQAPPPFFNLLWDYYLKKHEEKDRSLPAHQTWLAYHKAFYLYMFRPDLASLAFQNPTFRRVHPFWYRDLFCLNEVTISRNTLELNYYPEKVATYAAIPTPYYQHRVVLLTLKTHGILPDYRRIFRYFTTALRDLETSLDDLLWLITMIGNYFTSEEEKILIRLYDPSGSYA